MKKLLSEIVVAITKAICYDIHSENITERERGFVDALLRYKEEVKSIEIIKDADSQLVLLVKSRVHCRMGITITSEGFMFSREKYYIPKHNRLFDISEWLKQEKLYKVSPEVKDPQTALIMFREDLAELQDLLLLYYPEAKEFVF